MSILTRWLLIPPVNARLIGRYRDYRRHGASAFSATLGCFWMILAWIFIPLEHPRWQRIRAEHKNLYPHINASRPRPLDPVRYLIQTCWLLIGTSRKETPKPRRRAFSGLQNIRGRYHQWMNELPERVSHKTQHLDEKKELGHLSAGARRLILGIIVTFSLILALICVTQPFNPLAQFIFLMLLWGVALIVRRMPGRFSALMLIVLSLTVSCRYIWWRYTSTLNWDDPVSLVCGLILLFAETYAWIVLVLGYFQVVWPLNRQPVPLPKDMSLWPSVDIFVPTYNEDLNVVKNTIYASLNTQRRVALAQAQLGDTAAAQQTFNKLIPQAKSQPPSMESAMVLRDGAKFEAQAGDPKQALETYKDAMVASGVTTTRPQDNDTFTRLTRNDEKDDWLKRGVRSDAADLYRQQDLNVTLEHDYWGSSGTGGYSDLKAHTTMLQVDAPYSDGRMFFRSDFVNMNVGSFSTNADGKWDDNWGTCTLQDCSGNRSQSDSGASVAVGWRNDVWSWDIGTTPMGFNVVDVVGGISYSDDIGPLGYTVNAHRRPISSSLLAFGGQKDSPSNTGKKWGGVRADGVGLSLSYDKGEANGVWASLSGDQLTGKNVEDNWRVRWMTGYYYKVINQNNRRVTIGLNNMIWHYDKDLSGYSLGQGGYYSPQEYLSFAIPVMWRERTENWSWELGASGSWSHSRTKTMPRYPLMNLIPTDWQEEAARQSNDGGSSQGFGYTARALLERRVTSNWFVGTAIDIQQAKDYAPSHFLLYVRYSAAGWQGDMDLPPQPLIPYADW